MTVVINGTTGIDTGTGSLIAADSTTPTYLDLFEDTDNGSNYVRLIAPTSVASNRTITLPDGTGTVAVNGVSGVLVSGTAITLTNQTAPEFTGIPSWVRRITVMFNGVSTSGTSNLLIQLGTSGGIVSTGYASGAWTSNTNNVSSTAGVIITGVNTAAATHYGIALVCNVSGNVWLTNYAGGWGAGTADVGGGSITLGGTLDRVRITTVNGTDTFDAGSINILYE